MTAFYENRSDFDPCDEHDSVYKSAITAYLWGDYIGSSLETNSICYRSVAGNHVLERIRGRCHSTDETDLVQNFHRFITEYGSLQDKADFLLNWCCFITDHHGIARYGKSFPDFFRLVKHLRKTNQLDLNTIYQISKDRNSFGNGCLPLVYPLFHYLTKNNLSLADRFQLIIHFTRLTHYHQSSVSAVAWLFCFLDIALKGSNPFDFRSYQHYMTLISSLKLDAEKWQIFLSNELHLSPPAFIDRHKNNVVAIETLSYALYCVKSSADLLDMIGRVAGFGGDVDSVLSLGMMVGTVQGFLLPFNFLKNSIGFSLEYGQRNYYSPCRGVHPV
jgi:ADP-ribosylglycohydrolase